MTKWPITPPVDESAKISSLFDFAVCDLTFNDLMEVELSLDLDDHRFALTMSDCEKVVDSKPTGFVTVEINVDGWQDIEVYSNVALLGCTNWDPITLQQGVRNLKRYRIDPSEVKNYFVVDYIEFDESRLLICGEVLTAHDGYMQTIVFYQPRWRRKYESDLDPTG